MNEQPYTQSQPIKPAKKHRGLKIVGYSLLLAIVIGGVGYLTYTWQQENQTSAASINDKNAQIDSLTKSLAAATGSTDKTVATSGNVIAIRELGISISVPDALKDVTYNYKSAGKDETVKSEVVSFSTKKITDLNRDGMCSAYVDAPLGALVKMDGQFPDTSDAGSPPSLVKQFDDYYVAYAHPQSYCTDDASQSKTISSALSSFIEAIKSVKEL